MPDSEWVDYTREQLHRMVWSTPMYKLAQQERISNVGLKKICRKLEVPTPPPGHWAKLRAGHDVTPEPLKAPSEGTPTTYRRAKTAPKPAHPAFDAIAERFDTAKTDGREVERHEILAKITRQKRPSFGALGVDVSGEHLDRAIGILNDVLHRLSAAKIPVKSGAATKEYPSKRASGIHRPNEGCLMATINEVDVPFSIRELYDTVWTETPQPSSYDPDYVRREYEYVRNGRLALFIGFADTDTYFFGREVRRNWADGKKQRVENLVARFCEGLIAAAEAIQHRDEKRAEQRREWAEREANRQRQAEAQRRTERRLADLDERLRHMNELALLERLQAELRREFGVDPKCLEWLEWLDGEVERRTDRVLSPPSARLLGDLNATDTQ